MAPAQPAGASVSWTGEDDGARCYVDVKATRTASRGAFFVSLSEVRWAASHLYRIARVTGVGGDAVDVVILDGMSALAEAIVAAVQGMPPGVEPQTFRVDVDQLTPIATYALGPVEDDGEEAAV